MSVTVIATGGTIDCMDAGGVLSVGVTDLTPYIGPHTVVRPFTILSENITFDHYKKLVGAVREANGGVLVTHGSDTLPFTAAALAFCCSDLRKPIVLTAADAPLGSGTGNGPANLEGAMRLIGAGIPGVYVVYRNPGESASVFYGARLREAGDFDGYYAPAGELFARVGDRLEIRGEPSPEAPAFAPKFAEVFGCRFVPGVRYPTSKPVVMIGSHSGTANEAELKRLAARTDVYLCGGRASLVYASKHNVRGTVRVLDNISFPAAYIKACLAYGSGARNPAEIMLRPAINEFFA